MNIESDARHVLFIAEYGVLNGGERSLLSCLPSLKHQGWDFSAIVPSNSEFDTALNALGVNTFPFEKNDLRESRLSQTQIRDSLSRQIQIIQPALIHCNSLATSRLCGPVTRNLSIPAIGHLRDIIKLSRQAIADINQLDALVAVSHATRDWHVEQGMDADRIQVIYNGVDLNQFFPSIEKPESKNFFPICRELNIPSAVPLILFVGQIGVRKGVDVLVDAFAKILNQVPACRLLIVGQRNSHKPEAFEFEQTVQRLATETAPQNIHWLGRRTDVADLMRAATILIHPARQEPLGRVLLEAAASGLPIVTTNVGGTPEILAEIAEYNLIQPLDASLIAARAGDLLKDFSQRNIVSRRLRELANRRFCDVNCAAEIGRLYRATLKS